MSSITRFIRQRNYENSYLSASAVLGTTFGTSTVTLPTLFTFTPLNIFEFVPASNNTANNYPPGTMILASATQAAGSSNLMTTLTLINNYVVSSGQTVNNLVLRDMGKTIRAPVAVSVAAAATGTTLGIAYFRQVQLLYPTSIQSYIAGANPAINNVFGESLNNSSLNGTPTYVSFYIPVVVDTIGVNGLAAIGATPLPIGVVSGQM
jgi:hypothetical protein